MRALYNNVLDRYHRAKRYCFQVERRLYAQEADVNFVYYRLYPVSVIELAKLYVRTPGISIALEIKID